MKNLLLICSSKMQDQYTGSVCPKTPYFLETRDINLFEMFYIHALYKVNFHVYSAVRRVSKFFRVVTLKSE